MMLVHCSPKEEKEKEEKKKKKKKKKKKEEEEEEARADDDNDDDDADDGFHKVFTIGLQAGRNLQGTVNAVILDVNIILFNCQL